MSKRSLSVWIALLLLALFIVASPALGADDQAWRGEYYDNQYLSGAPALVRIDPNINFDWGEGAAAIGLPIDSFSVRWTRMLSFDAGVYRFQTVTDDGVRLWVDNDLVIDQWYDQSATAHAADVSLSAGQHAIRMEMYDIWSFAVARLDWSAAGSTLPTPTPTLAAAPPLLQVTSQVTWMGEYFNNLFLSGAPRLTRQDASISFDWGSGSPDPTMPADYFSVRWTRSLALDAGRYRFSIQTDDGSRFWINDTLVFDQWGSRGSTAVNNVVQVAEGLYRLRMEYFEETGSAAARLTWQPLDVAATGNLVAYAPPYPSYSWIKVYRWDWQTNAWVDRNPSGYASISRDGRIKLDGLTVDYQRYGATGHPYRVELYIDGQLVEAAGDFTANQPDFRIRAGRDNRTPWGKEVLAF